MWHDDSWQPYGEYDAPATSSWRHNRMAPPSMQNSATLNGGGPYARYARHYQPYSRPLAHPVMPPQHSPTLVGATREMTWRSANDGWGPPRMRNGVTAIASSWHDEMIAYHHHQQMARAHARALHEAALSKLSSVEITTPHAGGELRAKPIVCEDTKNVNEIASADILVNGAFDADNDSKRPLYNDFSAPEKPRDIDLRFEKSAIRITVSWTFPDLPALYKYKQKIEVRDSLTIIEEDALAPHITSFRFKTTPGCDYTVTLTIFDTKGAVVATSKKKCKAVFSLDEIDKLLAKAIEFTGTAMQPFSFLYRCKPKIYWDDIYLRRNGIMERYIKDNNGQAASPINGEISGMFFSAKTLADGSLPPSSPFGDIRMILPAISILDPTRISAFFCDFYCNRLTHYVTIVICERNSQTERFCNEKLRPLDLRDNRFLRITSTNNPNMQYAFYTNRSVWVEIYYTENIPMNWGRFDHIIATGAGTSKIGGVPHNKSCLTCNLYPVGPQSDIDCVEDLVAIYENNQARYRTADGDEEYIFPRNSTRYTTLGCIQSELLAPSTPISAEITKEDYLETAEVVVYCVDLVVYEASQARLRKVFGDTELRNVVEDSSTEDSLVENDCVSVIDTEGKPELKEVDTAEEKENGSSDEETKSKKFSSSAKVYKIIDNVTKRLPSSVPSIAHLIARLRALVKEMDNGFHKINTDIDIKLGKKRLLKDNENMDDSSESKQVRLDENWASKELTPAPRKSLPYHTLKEEMNEEAKKVMDVIKLDDDDEADKNKDGLKSLDEQEMSEIVDRVR